MKCLEKQQAIQSDNLFIAQLILLYPEKYKEGSLMRTWAEMIVKQSTDSVVG